MFNQSLAARGSSCQDQVVAAEEILQSLMQNVPSQGFEQHSHTTGLEARVKEARDKVEVLTNTQISLILALWNKEDSLSVMWNRNVSILLESISQILVRAKSRTFPRSVSQLEKLEWCYEAMTLSNYWYSGVFWIVSFSQGCRKWSEQHLVQIWEKTLREGGFAQFWRIPERTWGLHFEGCTTCQSKIKSWGLYFKIWGGFMFWTSWIWVLLRAMWSLKIGLFNFFFFGSY